MYPFPLLLLLIIWIVYETYKTEISWILKLKYWILYIYIYWYLWVITVVYKDNTTTNGGCLHLTVLCFPHSAELCQKIGFNETSNCQLYLLQIELKTQGKNKSSSCKTVGIYSLCLRSGRCFLFLSIFDLKIKEWRIKLTDNDIWLWILLSFAGEYWSTASLQYQYIEHKFSNVI